MRKESAAARVRSSPTLAPRRGVWPADKATACHLMTGRCALRCPLPLSRPMLTPPLAARQHGPGASTRSHRQRQPRSYRHTSHGDNNSPAATDKHSQPNGSLVSRGESLTQPEVTRWSGREGSRGGGGPGGRVTWCGREGVTSRRGSRAYERLR